MKLPPPISERKIPVGWSTDDEIAFIDNLGTFTEIRCSRALMVLNYCSALKLRVRWDKLDRGKILDHAMGRARKVRL